MVSFFGPEMYSRSFIEAMSLFLRERFRSLGKNWVMEEIGCMEIKLLDANEIVVIYKNKITGNLDALSTTEMLAYC